MTYSGFGSFEWNGIRTVFRIVIVLWHIMNKSNVMKPDTENFEFISYIIDSWCHFQQC